MKNNIFLKSMSRQTLRTILLMLLIAVAAFGFVMRSVEYIVITERINDISQYYRSIGFLSHEKESFLPVDVTAGAEIISASPLLAFEDRRRAAEGILQGGLLNRDIDGMLNRGWNFLDQGEGDTLQQTPPSCGCWAHPRPEAARYSGRNP